MQLGRINFGPELTKDFDKFFVGFDEQFSRLSKMHDDLYKGVPNYPPYNIKKTGDNTYVIEVAVAGFAKQDIEIELLDDKLVITGKAASDNADTMEAFLYKGIANRAFTRTFALNENIEIKDAEMLNGMLRVFLERIIPEYKKPKKIEVKDSQSSKQLLQEDPVEGRVL